jgi:hypothetical protein
VLLRCQLQTLFPDDIPAFGGGSRSQQDYHVSVGKEYVAVGLQFHTGYMDRRAGVWVHFVSDYGNLGWAPLQLFEIVDGRAARYWVARPMEDGLRLWPELLYKEFFHDHLGEGMPEAVDAFKRLFRAIELEAREKEA